MNGSSIDKLVLSKWLEIGLVLFCGFRDRPFNFRGEGGSKTKTKNSSTRKVGE